MRLTAHARSSNLQRALDMPREMREADIAPDVITYTCLLKTCQRQSKKALEVLEQMRSAASCRICSPTTSPPRRAPGPGSGSRHGCCSSKCGARTYLPT